MANQMTFVCLVMACSQIITLPKASGQASDWIILDENDTQDESIGAGSSAAMTSNSTEPCNETKHEQFCSCVFQIHLDPDEYVIVNDTAYVEAYNTSYNSSFYETGNGRLIICAPDFLHPGKEVPSGKYSLTLTYITIIGMAISMLCLVLHLIVFTLIPELRNIPGYCMACLCISLLAGYTSFLVGFDDYIISSGIPCIAAAASTHFFLLSSVLWMNVMAYDVFKSLLDAVGKLRVKSTDFCFRNFYMYCLYSWGLAAVFAVIAVVSDVVPNFPETYRPQFGQGFCWFKPKKALLVFFAAPIFTVICMNLLFFALSAYIIVSNRMKKDNPHRGRLKRNFVMYARLAVLMGLTWVTGLLAGIIDAVFLWYIFAVLNSLYGFFIFLAFSCTPKVKKQFSSMNFSSSTLYNNVQSYFVKGKSTSNLTVVQTI